MRLTRVAARIEPRNSGTQRASRSTAHGVRVVQYMRAEHIAV